MNRYLTPYIADDLKKKMVFLAGPRQVGKTTLSKQLAQDFFPKFNYFNWDASQDRAAILAKEWLSSTPFIIFDELHKMPKWKQWIKGVYDTRPDQQQYMVTGSARLDTYKKGGDSLLGRYHYWRLHPLTLDEIPKGISKQEAYERLLTLGGFPEPFLMDDEREARRWRRERFDRILREDILDLEQIRNLQLLQLFVDALRERAGSLITLSNIAKDLQISPNTAKEWLLLIEKMYLAFPVYPLSNKVPRSILKPPKVFFYDNADVIEKKGDRLENLVATHLLKRLHFLEDYHGYKCSLHYIRDKDGREVDFVTIIDNKVHELIEVKQSNKDISSALKYFQRLLKPDKTVQLVGNLSRSFDKEGIRVTTPVAYFSEPLW